MAAQAETVLRQEQVMAGTAVFLKAGVRLCSAKECARFGMVAKRTRAEDQAAPQPEPTRQTDDENQRNHDAGC